MKTEINMVKSSDIVASGSLVCFQDYIECLCEPGCLTVWIPKTKNASSDDFCMVVAWVRTYEEQGRKRVHDHWHLWVDVLNRPLNTILGMVIIGGGLNAVISA